MTGYYTTGQIAKLCRVCERTVAKWIDSGLLKGSRPLASQFRRVLASDLVAFMREHGMPEEWVPCQ